MSNNSNDKTLYVFYLLSILYCILHYSYEYEKSIIYPLIIIVTIYTLFHTGLYDNLIKDSIKSYKFKFIGLFLVKFTLSIIFLTSLFVGASFAISFVKNDIEVSLNNLFNGNYYLIFSLSGVYISFIYTIFSLSLPFSKYFKE